MVDRLLARPRYGERMAVAAGSKRPATPTPTATRPTASAIMWRWRDWVIEAFNRNMPFDQFTIEQLAGDLLPNATLDQRIATGFNRNHRGNAEGGIIPEEYAVEYVVDRVETTATVWLGLTLGCARCHDHKYDPITQKEFYQLFAYFNNVPETRQGDQVRQLAAVHQGPDARSSEATRGARRDDRAPPRSAWPLSHERTLKAQAEWDRRTAARPPTASPAVVAGRDGAGSRGTLAQRRSDLRRQALRGRRRRGRLRLLRPLHLACLDPSATARTARILSRMADEPIAARATAVRSSNGKLQVNLVKRWLDDALRVETERRRCR